MKHHLSYKDVLEVEKLKSHVCIKLTVWCNALHMLHNLGSPIVYGMDITTSRQLDN